MALTPCKECKQQISDSATACPHCGCPVNGVKPGAQEGLFLKTMNFGCGVVLVIIVLVVIAAVSR